MISRNAQQWAEEYTSTNLRRAAYDHIGTSTDPRNVAYSAANLAAAFKQRQMGIGMGKESI